MADQGVGSPDSNELANGGLAGIGALFGEVDVLAADSNIRPFCRGDHRWQQHRRWEKGDLIARVAGYER